MSNSNNHLIQYYSASFFSNILFFIIKIWDPIRGSESWNVFAIFQEDEILIITRGKLFF